MLPRGSVADPGIFQEVEDKFTPFLDIGVTLLQLSEFIEPFSEAESAPIRSAVKFYFDIDVRIFFQLLQKIFFRSIKKKLNKNQDINIEVKLHCGSNGSTLSL